MGLVAALVGVIAFAFNDLLFRLLGSQVSSWVVMVATSLALWVLCAGVLLFQRRPLFPPRLFGWAGLLAFFRVANTFVAICTFQYLPVSQAYLLIFTYPAMIVVFQAVFYRHFRFSSLASLLLSIIGLGVVFYSGAFQSLAGVVYGLLTAVTIAGQILTARKLPDSSPFQLSFYYSSAALMVAAVGWMFTPFLWSTPPSGWLGPLMGQMFVCVLGGLAYIYAAQKLPSARYAIFSYLQIPLAIFLAWVFLAEPISVRVAIGLVIIVAGSLLAQLAPSPKAQSLAIPTPPRRGS